MNIKTVSGDSLSNPVQWLSEHGDYLFRLAMLQLRDEHLSEDAVQETLLAALESHHRYSGKASEKTWLAGILKHKIVDLIRKKVREPNQEYLDEHRACSETAEMDDLFDSRGYWITPPQDWGNPEKMLEQKRFWEILTKCLKTLPPQLALLYSLREISGMATDEICKDIDISPTNSWVMLHRARLGLKQCFERNWLGQE